MILSYSDCGKGQLSHDFHDWAREYGITHGPELKTQGRQTHLCSKLKGLDPNKTYRIQELNKMKTDSFTGDGKTFIGDYIMKVGIAVNFHLPYESCVLHLVSIN